jgi:hypothetical protein
MATNYKITFKNHCTPQEYVTENARWYLDSDVGSRLTGGADAGITVTTQPVYSASTTLSTSAVTIGASTQDFVFIKNLGSTVIANAATPVSIGANTQDFVFIKNLGLTSAGVVSTASVLVALGGTAGKYRIKLAPGESFAAEIGQASAGSRNNDIHMKTGSGDAEQTVQTLRGT